MSNSPAFGGSGDHSGNKAVSMDITKFSNLPSARGHSRPTGSRGLPPALNGSFLSLTSHTHGCRQSGYSSATLRRLASLTSVTNLFRCVGFTVLHPRFSSAAFDKYLDCAENCARNLLTSKQPLRQSAAREVSMNADITVFQQALSKLLVEIFDGPPGNE